MATVAMVIPNEQLSPLKGQGLEAAFLPFLAPTPKF